MPSGYEDNTVLFESDATSGDRNATFDAALKENYEMGRTRGIDAAIKTHNLNALVLPAPVASSPAAIAGYPIITVPLGFLPANTTRQRSGGQNSTVDVYYPAPGVPYGISFFSGAWKEYELFGLAYAYEQATLNRLKAKAFPEAIPKTQLMDVIGKR